MPPRLHLILRSALQGASRKAHDRPAARLSLPARLRRTAIATALLLFAAASVGTASAHFLLNINIRVIHVEHLDEGLRLYIRLPMPFLVADKLGPARAGGIRAPAPFTTNVIEGGELMHYVDPDALEADPTGLGRIVAEGHRLAVGDQPLEPVVEALRAYPAWTQPPFRTLQQARAALRGPPFPPDTPASYVGDTVIDVALFYAAPGPVKRYSLAGRLRPGLPGEGDLANILLDHLDGNTQVHRVQGLLEEPYEVARSALAAAWSFVIEGIRHILEGLDHVLFVLCMTIGAWRIGALLWRVTGFTLGHSVTLAAGFFGFAPAGAWFVPSVEAAIAASIVYAGVVALWGRERAATFFVTLLIGLLHGFGFAFVLRDILRIDAANLWVSLAAFNVGVELGQVLIVFAAWPLLMLATRRSERLGRGTRVAVALPCVAVAAIWTGERLGLLLQSV